MSYMQIYILILATMIQANLNYNEAIDLLDSIRTREDLFKVTERVKLSRYCQTLYSIYIHDPYVLIPFYSKTIVNKMILCKIVGLKIHNLALMCFYRICNNTLDINLFLLIIKTKLTKGIIGGIGDYIIIKTAQFIHKSLLICLMEPHLFETHDSDIKEMYSPSFGYKEIYDDNHHFDYDSRNSCNLIFDNLEKINITSRYIPIGDVNKDNKPAILAYKIYLNETMRLGGFTNEYLQLTHLASKHLISKFNSNRSLINYLTIYNGIDNFLCKQNEMIDKYFLLINEKETGDVRLSIDAINDLYMKGKFRRIKDIYNASQELSGVDLDLSTFLCSIKKQAILLDRFEFDFYLSLIKLYSKDFNIESLLEVDQFSSHFFVKILHFSNFIEI